MRVYVPGCMPFVFVGKAREKSLRDFRSKGYIVGHNKQRLSKPSVITSLFGNFWK